MDNGAETDSSSDGEQVAQDYGPLHGAEAESGPQAFNLPLLDIFHGSSPQSPHPSEQGTEQSQPSSDSLSQTSSELPLSVLGEEPQSADGSVSPSPVLPRGIEDFGMPKVYQRDVVVTGASEDDVQALLDDIHREAENRTASCQRQTGIVLHEGLSVVAGWYRAGQEYHVIQEVGKGTFGKVHLCADTKTGMHFARKQVTVQGFARREVEVLLELQNIQNPSKENYAPMIYGIVFQEGVVFIFMEFIERTWKELAARLREIQISLPQVEDIMTHLLRQVLEVLNNLRTLGIVHCDIKPDNLGCSSDCSRSYLLDFGTVLVPQDKFVTKGMTPNYMSPEACGWTDDPDLRAGLHKIDIWAAAASVIYMYWHQHPWSLDMVEQPILARNPYFLLQHIAMNGGQMIEKYLYEISALMSDRLYTLLRHMLQPSMSERWSAEQCLQFLDEGGSRLSSTSEASSYGGSVPVTVSGCVLPCVTPSNQAPALADTMPVPVDSCLRPHPAADLYPHPYKLVRVPPSSPCAPTAGGGVLQGEGHSRQIARESMVRRSTSAESYTAQMAECRIVDGASMKVESSGQHQNPHCPLQPNPEYYVHQDRQYFDQYQNPQYSVQHQNPQQSAQCQYPQYSTQQAQAQSIIERQLNAQRRSCSPQSTGCQGCFVGRRTKSRPHSQAKPYDGHAVRSKPFQQPISQHVRDSRESSESARSRADSLSNSASGYSQDISNALSVSHVVYNYSAQRGRKFRIDQVDGPSDSSSGYNSIRPSHVAVVIHYLENETSEPRTEGFTARPGDTLGDIWEEMKKKAGLLIGAEACRGVYFTENGHELLKDHMGQSIGANRLFYVHLDGATRT